MRIGDYEVERELARGGMGVVYLARGPSGEQVAIKLLLAAGLATPEDQVRFRREAEALEALDHPGILRVQSHGVDAGRLYMVMDLLPGPTLADVVRLEGPLSEARAVEVGLRMAAALGHAHARGVVHRDFKPANVILRGDEPVLVDFGLALQLGLGESRLTETGTILGSPNYMAPEQAKGEADVGPAADVYGLGASLYYLLTGRPPFEGKGTLEILERVAGEDPLPPRDVRPELTPALEAVLLRCLEKGPSQRYPTAFALEQALSELAQGVAEVHGTSPAERAPYGLLLAAFGLAVAAVAILVVVSTGKPPSVEQIVTSLEQPNEPLVSLKQRERAQELVDSGSAKSQEGKHDEALENFDRALRLNPKDALAYAKRGFCKAQLKLYEEAIADYDNALELDTRSAFAYASRGASKAMLGRHEEAIEDYDKTLELEPKNAEAYTNRGAAFETLGRHAEATKDYTRALELNPTDSLTYANRGATRLNLGHYAEAAADFDRAFELGLLPQGIADSVRAWRSEAVSKLGKEARAKAQGGRFQEAIADFDRLLQLNPPGASAYAYRALSKQRLGRYAEAVEDYDRALQLDPSISVSTMNRGVCKQKLGRHEEALEDLDRALRLNPRAAEAHFNRGVSRVELGRLAEAIEDYDRALELGLAQANANRAKQFRAKASELLAREPRPRPVSAERQEQAKAWVKSGGVKVQEGLLEEALEDYARAIQLDPRSVMAYFNRGVCEQRLKRHAAAVEHFDRALELEPRSDFALVNRGFSKSQLGRYGEAIEDFDRALAQGLPEERAAQVREWISAAKASLAEQTEQQRNRARAFVRSGNKTFRARRFAEAIEEFESALELDPRNALAIHGRGLSRARLGRHTEAIEDFDRALELDPRHAAARFNRGTSKAKLGHHVEAIQDYTRSLELKLEPGAAVAYTNRGASKAHLKRYTEAIEDYTKALELNPRYGRAYNYRGQSKTQLSRHAEAVEDFTKALELNPRDDRAYDNRGMARASQGLHAEALRDYDKALELNPQAAMSCINRGVTKSKLGRFAEAVEDYDRALELGLPPKLADAVKTKRAAAAAKLNR